MVVFLVEKAILDIITILPQFNRTLDSAETYTKSFHHFYVAPWNLLGGTQLSAWIRQSFFYLPFGLQRPICIRNRPTNCPEHGRHSFRVLKLTASSWVVVRHLRYDKVSSNLEQVARNSHDFVFHSLQLHHAGCFIPGLCACRSSCALN
jgi:hypothetical protein